MAGARLGLRLFNRRRAFESETPTTSGGRSPSISIAGREKIRWFLVAISNWMKHGWIKAHQVDGCWAVHVDGDERRRLARLRRKHPSPGRPWRKDGAEHGRAELQLRDRLRCWFRPA